MMKKRTTVVKVNRVSSKMNHARRFLCQLENRKESIKRRECGVKLEDHF